MKLFVFCLGIFSSFCLWSAPVELGIDVFFTKDFETILKNKRLGLVVNQASVNQDLIHTVDLFQSHAKNCKITAIFSPEHGLLGDHYSGEKVVETKTFRGIPVFSLHGSTKRPTEKMLQQVDLLIYDIQEIGCRSYTYATTLFYLMEEAAKRKIPVIVLDRPNPINGLLVDGPMLEEKWKSFFGHVKVPYCHGMTIGELSSFFNEESHVGCSLTVIPMKGWKREMSFQETGLFWIPTSPFMPEPDTPIFYATTGILGELSLVSIGIGFSLPFKVVGAPWIQGDSFALHLNKQHLPGVKFVPFHFRPFQGLYKGETCQGVKIVITDPKIYHPLIVEYFLLGILKTLYPTIVMEKLRNLPSQKIKTFCQINGTSEIYSLLLTEKYVSWKFSDLQKKGCEDFLKKREKFLLY